MLSALDQTVIGNVLPSVVGDLDGFSLYSWAATGYMLTSMVTIPLFGRLGDLYGRKYFVLVAIVIFIASSVGCGLAQDMLTFVLARAVQGIGGGMLIGSGLACIPELFSDTEQRLKWQVLLNLVFTVSNAVGPVAGGWVAEHYGWRYVFHVNGPLGALAALMVWRYLPYYSPRDRHASHSLDWMGALLMTVALVMLQFTVEQLGKDPLWGLLLSSGCALLFVLFVRTENKAPQPFLAPALFRERNLRLLFILATLAGAVMFAVLFYLPLLFQGGYGYTPAFAGMLMLPFAVSSSLGSIASSRLLVRMKEPQMLPRAGFVLLATSIPLFAITDSRTPAWVLMGLVTASGVGMGFILLNLTIFTQAEAHREHLGMATALQKSLRLVGGLLGTAVISSLVNPLYVHYLAQIFANAGMAAYAPQYRDPTVLVSGLAGPGAAADPVYLMGLARQALERSIAAAFMLVFLISALCCWLVFQLSPIDIRKRTDDAADEKQHASAEKKLNTSEV
nr:MFS transporter [Pseudomonas typographi]